MANAVTPWLGQRADRIFLRVRREQRHQHGALFHLRGFGGVRSAHLEHDVSILEGGLGVRRDHRALGEIVAVCDARLCARPGFNGDLESEAFELLDGFRSRRDTRFACAAFLEDCEFHGSLKGEVSRVYGISRGR